MPDHSERLLRHLERRSAEVRKLVVDAVYHAGSGHIGGALSLTDALVCLYFHHMDYDPKRPDWEDRDRFVLSKGHTCAAMYACLALHGLFPVEELRGLRSTGHFLQGHPDMRKTPGVEFTTGSLGQGLSGSIGMALAARLDDKEYRVYCAIGDGECQEGQIWEAAASASHHGLDNLCVLLDRNGLQIDGPVEEIMSIEPLPKRWRSFGWHVIEVDGHDHDEILRALAVASEVKGQPTCIILKTIKGKGVSFMEGSISFHGRAPKDEEYQKAMEELGAELARIDRLGVTA
ncbi:MAG: transketolase [Euryarchaeota archaeon]|nr:transketolase [Euryarchaeota archaeon]